MAGKLPGQSEITVEVVARQWPPAGQASQGDFGRLRCREATQRREKILVGRGLATVEPGSWIRVLGHEEKHPTYGSQFVVDFFETTVAKSMAEEQGVAKLLTRLAGVGPKLGAKLAKQGLRTLIDDPYIIALAVPEKYRQRAHEEWIKMLPEAELAALFAEIGIGPGTTKRIFEACGGIDGTWKVLRQNPWALANTVSGISFERADQLSRRLGADPSSPARLRTGLGYLATKLSGQQGHTLLPIEPLMKLAKTELKVSEDKLKLAMTSSEDLVWMNGIGVSPRQLYRFEEAILQQLSRLPSWGGLRVADSAIFDVTVDRQLSESQMNAIRLLNENSVAILTGGPGTGKTTTSGAFVEACRRGGRSLLLLAPTGLAARRLSLQAEQEAMTIHRWIYHRHEMASECDAILIDECSMIDSQLMAQLLWAMNAFSKRLILVGDQHQLPPVSPGRPFADMIESGLFPTWTLNKIWRQAGMSVIPLVAKLIREQRYPNHGMGEAHNLPDERKVGLVSCDVGYRLYEFEDPHQVELVAAREALDQVRRFGMGGVAVLSPMYKGTAGIDSLGSVLQSRLNPREGQEVFIGKNGGRWGIGDPVMHISNAYDKGLTHAMRGKIIGIDHANPALEIFWEDGINRIHELYDGMPRQVILAYALSWHRSQGSEFPAVTVSLTCGQQRILSVEALYTALTRAKQEAVVVAEKGAIEMALGRPASARYTALSHLLAELI